MKSRTTERLGDKKKENTVVEIDDNSDSSDLESESDSGSETDTSKVEIIESVSNVQRNDMTKTNPRDCIQKLFVHGFHDLQHILNWKIHLLK